MQEPVDDIAKVGSEGLAFTAEVPVTILIWNEARSFVQYPMYIGEVGPQDTNGLLAQVMYSSQLVLVEEPDYTVGSYIPRGFNLGGKPFELRSTQGSLDPHGVVIKNGKIRLR